MAEAVALSKLHSAAEADRALGTAAVTARFADQDLLSILGYQAVHEMTEPVRRSENHSLQPGTSAWSAPGTPAPSTADLSEYDESDLT
jgi:hypothetical protein